MVRSGLASVGRSRPAATVLRPLSRRGLLPSGLWHRLPTPDQFEVLDAAGAPTFSYVRRSGDLASRVLYWRGADSYEPFAMGVFRQLAAVSSHIVDVGANTGVYTLVALAASKQTSVTSFEPNPRFRQALLGNLVINSWDDRCAVEEFAVAERSGTDRFYFPETDAPHSGRLVRSQYRFAAPSGEVIQVVSLDDYFRDRVVDLIKIDVEGGEHLVLAGAERLLQNVAPAIVFECHPEADLDAVSDLLESLGYRTFQLDGPRPRPLQRITPSAQRDLNNFLAIRRPEHIELLRSVLA